MYVTAISPRFSRGRSTPATRAIVASARSQPCRALCRGFLQMIRVTPSRLTILQCSQRTLIDGRTFIASSSPRPSLESIGDPASGQVVRRELDLHAVARQDPDEVHPHLAAHVREHL